jgi:hypothetical protein
MRVHFTTLVTVALVALAACSSATQQPPTNERVIAAIDHQPVLRDRPSKHEGPVPVAAAPDKILAALNAAYGDLGIEIKLWDPPHGQVGNRSFTKMFRLAGAPLSQYLACGLTSSGDAADSYRITMSLVSQVEPAAGGSTVVTTLSAYAEDLASSKGTISCGTRGILEDKVLELAMKHLTG